MHLIMGQIITTQNLVAIKEVRHAGQSHDCIIIIILHSTVDSSIHKQPETVTATLVLKRHTISIYSAEEILPLRD